MFGVRFLDPDTNQIVYPEPFEAPNTGITPVLGTRPTLIPNPLLIHARIQWDVRRSFQTHVTMMGWGPGEVLALSHPATTPPTMRLEIQSPQIPWKLDVFPTIPNLHVTVFDVVATIHLALKVPITKGEWDRFNDAQKHLILVSRQRRVRGYTSGRALNEMYCCPRRIDFLGEVTKFVGLAPAPHRLGLNVEFVRRS